MFYAVACNYFTWVCGTISIINIKLAMVSPFGVIVTTPELS